MMDMFADEEEKRVARASDTAHHGHAPKLSARSRRLLRPDVGRETDDAQSGLCCEAQ